MVWEVLIQFVFRLAFGLAGAMLLTSPHDVDSGFFRVHLWVLLGLAALAAAGSLYWVSDPELARDWFPMATAAGVGSYLGGVSWLYQRVWMGQLALAAVAWICLVAAWQQRDVGSLATTLPLPVRIVDSASSGLLVGATLAAMLLGHWYLNNPGMRLGPLRRLLALATGMVLVRLVVIAGGWAAWLAVGGTVTPWEWFGAALRGGAGIAGVLLLVVLAWHTLKIPNTQSATGILYVAVVLALIGELAGQLLSQRIPYPV